VLKMVRISVRDISSRDDFDPCVHLRSVSFMGLTVSTSSKTVQEPKGIQKNDYKNVYRLKQEALL
jgi:hypothetical protein